MDPPHVDLPAIVRSQRRGQRRRHAVYNACLLNAAYLLLFVCAMHFSFCHSFLQIIIIIIMVIFRCYFSGGLIALSCKKTTTTV